MSVNRKLCDQGIAYLKPIIKDDELSDEEPILLENIDMMFETTFNDELFISYLVDDKKTHMFSYIQNRHLSGENISPKEMHEIGINNLIDKANECLRIQEYGNGVYTLFLDGNFEASLILIDILWDSILKKYIKNNYVVAIPSRDVLVFCDIKSEIAIEELKSVCTRVAENGDHLLTNTLYYRKNNGWEKYL